MGLVTRLSNGWNISMKSFQVLKANKQLIILPVLSGSSMILLMASFGFAIFTAKSTVHLSGKGYYYLGLFGFYFVNYFIVSFFNVALMRCVRMHFLGEEVSLRDGLAFSVKRIGTILLWSVIGATVGTILRVIQQESGIIGKIITGIIGIIWNVATFFVIPVLAYEDTGPIEAVKRSASIMKEKWGESLAGNFSFGLVQLLALIVTAVPLYFLGSLVNPLIGIALAVFASVIVITIISAAQAIFISAVYHTLQGTQVPIVDNDNIDHLFTRK